VGFRKQRLRRVFIHIVASPKGQNRRPDGDAIAVGEQASAGERVVVDQRAVLAAGVADEICSPIEFDHSMSARDRGVFDDDVIVRRTADRRASVERRVFSFAGEFEDQKRHGS